MESLIILGNYITRRRDVLRLRQKDLATLSGISDATLRAIETGKPGVAIQNWIKVADILGLEMVLQTKKMSDRHGKVWNNAIEAGLITETPDGQYVFEYEEAYFQNPACPAISLTLPKSQKRHFSNQLFPFFYSLLSEGHDRALQCRLLKIDAKDAFGLLLKTAAHETIGAVRVEEIPPS